jgi:hypothetical protein
MSDPSLSCGSPDNPFIAAHVQGRLGGCGQLPADLLAANNSAVHAAALARNIVTVLACRSFLSVPDPDGVEIFKVALRALYANAGPSCSAVHAVESRLNSARKARGPVRFGRLVRANAHLAAIHYAAEVRQRIRRALLANGCKGKDAPAIERLIHPEATMDPEMVARQLPGIWQAIDLDGLPDADEIIAEAIIEVDMAATMAPPETPLSPGQQPAPVPQADEGGQGATGHAAIQLASLDWPGLLALAEPLLGTVRQCVALRTPETLGRAGGALFFRAQGQWAALAEAASRAGLRPTMTLSGDGDPAVAVRLLRELLVTGPPFGADLLDDALVGRLEVLVELLRAGQANAGRDTAPLGDFAGPCEGDDWDALEPMVRRLLLYMNRREKADLRALCPEVWGKDYADVSDSARETATSKANKFLNKRQAPRSLEKVPGEPYLRWV